MIGVALLSISLALQALAGVPATTPHPAMPAWSPKGDWIAYTLSTRESRQVLPAGWFLGGWTNQATSQGKETDSRSNRLWVSRPSTNEHVRLDETSGPLSSPCWAPDGSAIAYVRVVAAPDQADRAIREVVLQHRPGTPVVLFQETFARDSVETSALNGATLAWSPDGKLLAVPRLAPAGLDIVQVENGHRLRVLEGAESPAWSRAGNQLAYFHVGEGGSATLAVLEGNLEGERRLLTIPKADGIPAPVWMRDDRSILVIRSSNEVSRLPGQRGPVTTQMAQLVRVPVDGGDPIPFQLLTLQPIADPDVLRSATFSLSPDGAHVFFATNSDQEVSQITWAQPEREVIQVRFNPVDPSVSLQSLSLEPDGRRLAFRAGDPGTAGPVALCDPATQEVTPLAPDADARVEWLALLLDATRRHLNALPIRGGDSGIERAAVLPAPFELGPDAMGISGLRRLSRIGRPLCDLPAAESPRREDSAAAIAEARFVFDYLRLDGEGGHFREAADSLATLENQATTPAQRFRWLCLQAQVQLGLGHNPRVRQIVDYLRESTPWALGRLEDTPAGFVLSPAPNPEMAWLDLLSRAIESTSAPSNDQAMPPSHAPARPGVPMARPVEASPRNSPPTPGLEGRVDEVDVNVVP